MILIIYTIYYTKSMLCKLFIQIHQQAFLVSLPCGASQITLQTIFRSRLIAPLKPRFHPPWKARTLFCQTEPEKKAKKQVVLKRTICAKALEWLIAGLDESRITAESSSLQALLHRDTADRCGSCDLCASTRFRSKLRRPCPKCFSEITVFPCCPKRGVCY